MASSSGSPEVEVVVAAMVVKEPPEPSEKKDPSEKKEPSEFILRKYLLMLATLVATVTYGVGFNPPGGAWQEQDSVGGHLAGDPIVRTTNNLRYLVFFYCNAMALASSVLVIVLFLLLSIDLVENKVVWVSIRPLRVVMVLDLLSFLGAYAAGSCRDTLTTVYTAVLMAGGVSTYLTVQAVLRRGRGGGPEPPPPPPHLPVPLPADQDNKTLQLQLKEEERLRKALMVLATFALSITYVSGLNSPGGFWDSTWGGHHPGDAILRKSRLTTFFVCNTTAFMSSLLIIMLLLGRKLHERKTTVLSREMLACVVAVLVGLVGAYAGGSCREGGATAYVTLVVAAGLVCLVLVRTCTPSSLHNKDEDEQPPPERVRTYCWLFSVPTGTRRTEMDLEHVRRVESARSLLLLLTTFAMAITYPAGLDPPGGVWQDNNDGHLAGDPILLTSNAIRYKIFFYCNSIAFVAPLTTIVLFVLKILEKFRRVSIEAVIIAELFGLVGAYSAGACRDMTTSIHVMALGGAVHFYVVIHGIFFWKGPADDPGHQHQELVELDKKRKLLYLLATLSTAVSYQAGLNPPAGFWLQDDEDNKHAAGNPVLLYNHPGHYHAFFYCNSLSFMLSVTTMILLMNPDLYRPAIRSGALTLCTVTGLCCLMGAYAAGSTQHLTPSISIFVFMAVAFLIVVLVSLIFFLTAVRPRRSDKDPAIGSEQGNVANLHYTKQRKKLMLMGILVAGVTYQAGLDQPGGVWQSGDGAGGPVMRDNRKQRYLAFFYSNSTSFAASILMLLLLLLHPQQQQHHRQLVPRLRRVPLHIRVLQSVVIMNLLALLVAYTSGSSRDWRSSLSIAGLAIAFPAYQLIDRVFSPLFCHQRRRESATISS